MTPITHLNYSRVRTAFLCLRKFFYRYVLGIVPRAEDIVLTVGSAVHHGLAEHYRGSGDTAAESAARDYLERRMRWWRAPIIEEWKEEAGYISTMINEYRARKFPADDFTVRAVEEPFMVEIASGFYWCGTTDLEVERNGHLAIMDHKTTAYTPSDEYLEGFSRSFQLLGYVYSRAKQTGEEIREFGVNALQKAKTLGKETATLKNCPECNNGKKKKLTCNNCKGLGKVEKLVPLVPFRRRWFPVFPEDLERFELFALEAFRVINDHLSRFLAGDGTAFPMNDAGCKTCEYKEFCWGSSRNWTRPDADEGIYQIGVEDYVDAMASEENI